MSDQYPHVSESAAQRAERHKRFDEQDLVEDAKALAAQAPLPATQTTVLPTDAVTRKGIPIASGFIDYFPDAMAEVAKLSKAGNDQHNPGKPLHWDRSKSGDESDALIRHFLERGTFDTDGQRHSAKVAWRAMANLQKELEEARANPVA